MDFTIFLGYTFSQFQDKKIYSNVNIDGWLLWAQSTIRKFSHDVTKIQTTKLSISKFYFHEVLQHLETFSYRIFRSKGFFVLR